jgi:hypothetical protein
MFMADPDEFDDLHRDHPARPAHSRKFAQFSIEWYEACERAFKTAMQDEIRRLRREMKEAS